VVLGESVRYIFRPSRMHQTRTIAIDGPGRLSVYQSVNLSETVYSKHG